MEPQAGPPPQSLIPGRRSWRRATDLLLLLLVAWSGRTLFWEARGARHDWRRGIQRHPGADYWKPGTPEPERMRRCVASLGPSLAAGETVLLWDPTNDFYRWRWAAYFLPDREVATAGPGAPSRTLVIATSPTAPPGASLVARGAAGNTGAGDASCGLYRLR